MNPLAHTRTRARAARTPEGWAFSSYFPFSLIGGVGGRFSFSLLSSFTVTTVLRTLPWTIRGQNVVNSWSKRGQFVVKTCFFLILIVASNRFRNRHAIRHGNRHALRRSNHESNHESNLNSFFSRSDALLSSRRCASQSAQMRIFSPRPFVLFVLLSFKSFSSFLPPLLQPYRLNS